MMPSRRVFALAPLLFASALCMATEMELPDWWPFKLSAGGSTSAGTLAIDDGPIQLRIDSDGVFRVPVVNLEGAIDSFWTLNSDSFYKTPVEAGKAPLLKVGNLETKTPLLVSKVDGTGVMGSRPFEITPATKSLEMRLVGKGDVTVTYAKFIVSFDGGIPVDWSRQAPSSVRSFDLVRWDLSKVHERAAGKRVIGQILLVDGSQDGVIGVAAAPAAGELPPIQTPNRADFTFSRLFLGPRLRSFEGFEALIRDGEQYARYFGVKGVDSLKNFGMPKEDMYAVLVEVNKLVASSEFDHDPNTWRQLSLRLTEAALKVANKKVSDLGHSIADPVIKADFEYFVKLQAIHEWVRSRIEYSDDEAAGRITRSGGLSSTMSMTKPSTVCGGFTWAIVYFATQAGLNDVYKIGGSCKISSGSSSGFDHSWNVARLPSGALVLFDSVRTYLQLEHGVRDRNGRTFSPFGLVPETWQLGFAFAYFHNQVVIAGVKSGNDIAPQQISNPKLEAANQTGVDFFTGMKWEEWSRSRITRPLELAHMFYFFLYDRQ